MPDIKPELIELLFQQESTEFEARFQSFLDQIPKAKDASSAPGKPEFFTHFFRGMFSSIWHTELAKKIGIEKLYFNLDNSGILKIVAITHKDNKYKGQVFIFDEHARLTKIGKENRDKALIFSDSDWSSILAKRGNEEIKKKDPKFKIRLIEVNKDKATFKNKDKAIEAIVHHKSLGTSQGATNFQEIIFDPAQTQHHLEREIVNLANKDPEILITSLREILKKFSTIHTRYPSPQGSSEAVHHGFLEGFWMNFRYRYNMRPYLELSAGAGHPDIVLLVRGQEKPDGTRSLDSIPIIIELKAGASGNNTTVEVALQEARDYSSSFQYNAAPLLTRSLNQVICVGINLNRNPCYQIETVNVPLRDTNHFIVRAFENIDRLILTAEVKKQVNNIRSILPKSGIVNDISRFFLGQSLLLHKYGKGAAFTKHLFLHNNDIRPIGGLSSNELCLTMMVFVEKTETPQIVIVNLVENKEAKNKKNNRPNKKLPLDSLWLNGQKIPKKIIEINISCNTIIDGGKSTKQDSIIEINNYNSFAEYYGNYHRFDGSFSTISYSETLRQSINNALDFYKISPNATQPEQQTALKNAYARYQAMVKEISNILFGASSFIQREAHFQAVLQGLFSYYSNLESGQRKLPEMRRVVVVEFQTGKDKKIDLLIQGIGPSLTGGDEYMPVALELKGPRKGSSTDILIQEAKKGIKEKYQKGVTYKTLTDGTKVAIIGVVFDDKAIDRFQLIKLGDQAFTLVTVDHSSTAIIGRITEAIGQLVIIEDYQSLEDATKARHYAYWLQQHDIADIARIGYRDDNDGTLDTSELEIVGSLDQLSIQLERFRSDNTTQQRTMIININGNHWVTLVVSRQQVGFQVYYVDSLGNRLPDDARARNMVDINIRDRVQLQDYSSLREGVNADDLRLALRSRNLIGEEITTHDIQETLRHLVGDITTNNVHVVLRELLQDNVTADDIQIALRSQGLLRSYITADDVRIALQTRNFLRGNVTTNDIQTLSQDPLLGDRVNITANNIYTVLQRHQLLENNVTVDEIYLTFQHLLATNLTAGDIRLALQAQDDFRDAVIDLSTQQQTDGYNCGLWALENAIYLNQMLQENAGLDWVNLQLDQPRNENYFKERRNVLRTRLLADEVRRGHLQDLGVQLTNIKRKQEDSSFQQPKRPRTAPDEKSTKSASTDLDQQRSRTAPARLGTSEESMDTTDSMNAEHVTQQISSIPDPRVPVVRDSAHTSNQPYSSDLTKPNP